MGLDEINATIQAQAIFNDPGLYLFSPLSQASKWSILEITSSPSSVVGIFFFFSPAIMWLLSMIYNVTGSNAVWSGNLPIQGYGPLFFSFGTEVEYEPEISDIYSQEEGMMYFARRKQSI